MFCHQNITITSHEIPGSFKKMNTYYRKSKSNFLFLNVLKGTASFLFLCYASILKWFRHSCNRCLNSNQILLIDPLPFHSFLNLNMYGTLVTRMVAFSKVHVFMSDQILYWILSVRRRILANYGNNGFGILSPKKARIFEFQSLS